MSRIVNRFVLSFPVEIYDEKTGARLGQEPVELVFESESSMGAVLEFQKLLRGLLGRKLDQVDRTKGRR